MNVAEGNISADGNGHLGFILKTGILAAVFATVISAILIAVSSAAGPRQPDTVSPSALDLMRMVLLLCPITAVSCGSYGLLAGLLGGALLNFRRRRIRSVSRLLIEAGALGFVLGFFFLFYDHFVGQASVNGLQILFSAPGGALCALLAALILRRRFVPAVKIKQALA